LVCLLLPRVLRLLLLLLLLWGLRLPWLLSWTVRVLIYTND
jgi:hypothetical protein